MKWKVLSSEYIFNDDWLKIRKEKFISPSGKIIEPYYVYDFPTWVAAVAMTEDGKVVLVKQYRHAIGETFPELPGGCVDSTDKNNDEAIARELLEETGYSFTSYESLGRISANTSTNSNWLYMYLAKGGKKISEQRLDQHEEIEVVIVSIEELKTLVRENKIAQAMHVSCILYALEKLSEINL